MPNTALKCSSPGSLGPVDDLDIVLTFSHDDNRPLARSRGGGLLLTESTSMLSAQATLPATRECDDTLALIKQSIIKGLSIEFLPVSESRNADGIRIVEKANLLGISVVSRPAFPASTVEARRALTGAERLATLRSSIPARKRLDCRCSPKDCDEAVFEPEALDDVVELSQPRPPGPTLVFEPQPAPAPTYFQPPTAPRPLAPAPTAPASPLRPLPVEPPAQPPPTPKRNVLAVQNEYTKPIGSTSDSSVRIWPDTKGGIEVAVDVSNTEAGRSLLDVARTVDVYVRPILNLDRSVYTITDRVATYKKAYIRGFQLGSTDSIGGWVPAYVQVDPEDDAPAQERRSLDRWERTEGRRVWL